MADANSYSGDECTDDEEDGEELDPRVQVSLNFETDTRSSYMYNRTDVNSVCIQLCKWDLNEPKIL